MDSVEHYQAFFKTTPGQHLSWLEALRAAARQRFINEGFPNGREEAWRYTPLRQLERSRFRPSTNEGSAELGMPDLALLEDAYTLVFIDGHYAPLLSRLEGLPPEVSLRPMSLAFNDPENDLSGVFRETETPSAHRLDDFNTALFSDGLCLDIKPEFHLVKPIVVLHLAHQPEGLNTLQHRIRLGRGAQARLIEVFMGRDDRPSLTTSMTHARLKEHSTLQHVTIQREGNSSYHFNGLRLHLEKSTHYDLHLASLGGLWSRTEAYGQLDSSAECELEGLFIASGRQHQEIDTRMNHLGSHASSRQNFRGIAQEGGKGVFTGRIVVEPDAQKTDAGMRIRNLLLSPGAEIDARPQLEIHADDVKCSHGVTVGQLDEEAVFTLQSRGIDEQEARNMLIFAFANELIERVEPVAARTSIREAFEATLPRPDLRGEF